MTRDELFATAAGLISGDRQDVYGTARENFTDIGNLWAVVFGHPVSPEQVALCCVLIKVARLVKTPSHADSWVDILGYGALGGEIATS